jgi:hypothetical protein
MVGRSGGMLAHGGGLPADVLGQRPDDLAQGGTDRVVGLAQNRDVAVRGPSGHVQLRRELAMMPGWVCSSSRARSARPVGLRAAVTEAD